MGKELYLIKRDNKTNISRKKRRKEKEQWNREQNV